MNEGFTVAFACPAGQVIDQVAFSSYGTPSGDCSDGGPTAHMRLTESESVWALFHAAPRLLLLSNVLCLGENFKTGACNAAASVSAVEKECLGKVSCSFKVTNSFFGGDPCDKVWQPNHSDLFFVTFRLLCACFW